jgi:hypothetical protein
MYREDTHRKAPIQAFLGRGFVPLGLNEDDPAIMTMGTVAADEHDRTYEILNR